ncbi:MAG: hypothetical protein ACKPKO_00910 [Candidatus Fonsibacter sp.]
MAMNLYKAAGVAWFDLMIDGDGEVDTNEIFNGLHAIRGYVQKSKGVVKLNITLEILLEQLALYDGKQSGIASVGTAQDCIGSDLPVLLSN